MLRTNPEKAKELKKALSSDNKANYKGFLIIKCTGNFGDRYYTLVNVKTQNHVHAKSLPLAMQICDVARHMFYNPTYHGRGYSKDVFIRASKLTYREVKYYN